MTTCCNHAINFRLLSQTLIDVDQAQELVLVIFTAGFLVELAGQFWLFLSGKEVNRSQLRLPGVFLS